MIIQPGYVNAVYTNPGLSIISSDEPWVGISGSSDELLPVLPVKHFCKYIFT